MRYECDPHIIEIPRKRKENSNIDYSGAPFLDDFFAGTVAGMSAVVVSNPFDVVKTRIQTVRGYPPSILMNVKKIWNNEGFYGFYKGMASPLLFVGGINAIVFGVYANTLRKGFKVEQSSDASYSQVMWAGSLAGFASCSLCCPSEYVKVQMQIQEAKSPYKSMHDCYQQIYRVNGFRGLFKGMVPTMWREVPSYGLYFGTYEFLKRRYGEGSLSLLFAGGMGGLVAWMFSYPFDVMKSRIQAQPLPPNAGHDRYTGMLHCMKKTFASGGYKVFFHGMSACIIRSFPVNALTFYVYELTLGLLEQRHNLSKNEM